MAVRGRPRLFYGYIIVLLATLIMVVTWGTFYSFGVFFKPVLLEFGWTRAATSAGYSLGFMLSGLFGILTGRLSDRFGPRMVVTFCGLLIAAGYLLTSQISAIWQLYLFYGMVGIGSSGAYVPSISAVSRWFIGRRGLMTGIAMAGIGLGTMVMSPLANWLITNYGWRFSYIVVGVAVLLLITLLAQFLRRDPGEKGMRAYGDDFVDRQTLLAKDGSLAFGRAVRTRQFWTLCAMFTLVEYSVHNINVHIVPHATDLGISAASAAQILAIIGAMSVTSRIVMGALGDRVSRKAATVVCFVIMLASLVCLLFTRELWSFKLFAVAFGFAYGGYQPLISMLVVDSFGLGSLGVILGTITFTIMAGSAVGPILAGRMFDLTGSYQPAFLICVAFCIIGISLGISLRPVVQAKGETDIHSIIAHK